MKITTTQLRRLIAEEVRRLVEGDRVESFVPDPGRREPLDSRLRRMSFDVKEGLHPYSIQLTLGSFSIVMSYGDAEELGFLLVRQSGGSMTNVVDVGGEVVDPNRSYTVEVKHLGDGGVTVKFTRSDEASKNRRAAPAFNTTLSADEAAALADLLQSVGMDA